MKVNGQFAKINTATDLSTIGSFISSATVTCQYASPFSNFLVIRAKQNGQVIRCNYNPLSVVGHDEVVGIKPQLEASVKINGKIEKDPGRTKAIVNVLRTRKEVIEWDVAKGLGM